MRASSPSSISRWFPGDEWDFDTRPATLLLADVATASRASLAKVIMQANKNGFYYVIDRVTKTQKFISGQPFAQVTWARGLNEETGKPIINPESYYGTQTIPIAPGPGGAHNWSPMSFNPATGLVYLPASPGGSFNYASDPNFKFQEGKQNMGIAFGGFGRGGAAAAAVAMLPTPLQRCSGAACTCPRLRLSFSRLPLPSDRLRPKVTAAEACCWPGTWSPRRNAGARKAAAGSAGARFRPRGTWFSR